MAFELTRDAVSEYQFFSAQGDRIRITRFGQASKDYPEPVSPLNPKWVVTMNIASGFGSYLAKNGEWVSKHLFSANDNFLFDTAEQAVQYLKSKYK